MDILATTALLDQIPQSVFVVRDNIIVYANHGAQQRDVQLNTNISDLITIGYPEYQAFTAGKLILSICVSGIHYNAVVTKAEDCDMFCLESEYSNQELRAFALAAQSLREPLQNALIGIDKMLPNETIQESPALLEQVKQINKSVYQIHRAVRNMSDAATYHQSSSTEFENKNAVNVIAEIVDKAATLLKDTGIKIEFKSTIKQPVYCQINQNKLERALLNLISNAGKYASSEKPILISLRLGMHKLYVSVQCICNQAKETLNANLFSGFLREPSVTDGRNGIGLGLAIVHGAAIAHKGTLLIEKPDDNSLRFTISLSLESTGVVKVNSPVSLLIDRSGGYDQALIELSEILPADLFE